MIMRRFAVAFLFVFALGVLGLAPAHAQGCGPTNPNCIVPTAPTGTNNNQAASTAFVQNQIAASGSGPLASTHIFVGNASNVATDFGTLARFATTGGMTLTPSTGTALTINSPATTQNIGFAVTQSTSTNAAGLTSFDLNTITVTGGANVTSGFSLWPAYFSPLHIIAHAGGTNAKGSVWGFVVDTLYDSASTQNGDLIGIQARCRATVVNSGTGGCYGMNPNAVVASGGSVPEVAGLECDSSILTGGTALWRFGCASVGSGNVHASVLEAAYEIGAVALSWDNGFALNDAHGNQAISTTGSLFTSLNSTSSGQSAATIANIFNLPNLNITGSIFNFANFQVTGAGAVTAVSVTANGSISVAGTAGAGFLALTSQSSNPAAAGGSNVRLFTSSAGNLAWIKADGFVRSLASTLTADRIYTLPDATTTLAGLSNTQTFTVPQTINNQSATTSITLLTLNQDWSSGNTANIMTAFTSYGDVSRFLARRANGSQASPTQILSGDALGNFGFRGYHSGGAFSTASPAAMVAVAEENFTSTAWGTALTFFSTPDTTVSAVEAGRFQGSGCLSVGYTTACTVGVIAANNGFKSGASAGLSTTKTVRASGGVADCTLIYTGGILTGGSC